MGSISGVSGMSNAWTEVSTQRSQMQTRLFTRVDVDSSSPVDKSGLDSMLSDLSEMTGTTLDIDQDGTVSELEHLADALKDFVSSADSSATTANTSDNIMALAKLVYQQISSSRSATRGNTLSVTA